MSHVLNEDCQKQADLAMYIERQNVSPSANAGLAHTAGGCIRVLKLHHYEIVHQ